LLRGSAGLPAADTKIQANGEAPTAKTAGAFTIANFDNSLNGQCIRWPAYFLHLPESAAAAAWIPPPREM
jgi:hypothetical protein